MIEKWFNRIRFTVYVVGITTLIFATYHKVHAWCPGEFWPADWVPDPHNPEPDHDPNDFNDPRNWA